MRIQTPTLQISCNHHRFAKKIDLTVHTAGGERRWTVAACPPSARTGHSKIGRRTWGGRQRRRRRGSRRAAAIVGMNPMDLTRGIDIAAAAVVKDIERRAKKVQSSEEIAQVGTISANGDKAVGCKMIADAVR